MNSNQDVGQYPAVIDNWRSMISGNEKLGSYEFPLFTDAHITGEVTHGPYTFLNTISSRFGRGSSAIILRYTDYSLHQRRPMDETDDTVFHGGSPAQEIAALASLAMGIRLRAGDMVREFRQYGDPLGNPIFYGKISAPQLNVRDVLDAPVLKDVTGMHSLDTTYHFESLPKLSSSKCIALVRAARLYQDSLWLAESETSLSWTMLVSAVETAANHWRADQGDDVERLQVGKPRLYEFLKELSDKTILPFVAREVASTLGSTKKFVDFLVAYLPEPPVARPPEGFRLKWEPEAFKKAFLKIYEYRSRALHDGKPFPPPMCEGAYSDPSWEARSETITGLATSTLNSVWVRKDTPLHLSAFHYIAQKALLTWWASPEGDETFRA